MFLSEMAVRRTLPNSRSAFGLISVLRPSLRLVRRVTFLMRLLHHRTCQRTFLGTCGNRMHPKRLIRSSLLPRGGS